MKRWSFLAGLALLAAVQACGSDNPTQPNQSIQVSTTKSSAAGLTLTGTVTNTGNVTQFIERCGDKIRLSAQIFQNNAWANVTQPACATTDAPLELAPGASATADYTVSAAGRYRLRTVVSSKNDLTNSRTVHSDGFDLE